MKETLTVKREGLAVRCEVCHQTDRFDPQTGVCGRCSDAFSREPISSWDALERLNIPQAFHSVFLDATRGERVWWAGRPVARLARHRTFVTVLLLLLPSILTASFLLWIDVPGLLFMAVFPVLITGVPLLRGFCADRRIDHTLYVLTERRAMVLRDDRPQESKIYRLGKKLPRCTIIRRKKDIGHLIFFQEEFRRGSFLKGAWDRPVHAGFLTERHDRGFFYIENVREVERLVRERMLPRDEA